jgi:hypothetical protein
MRGIVSWTFTLTLTLLLGGACQKSRFATCETDEDCASRDESKSYCFNVRCVACAYDRHCEAGEICDTKSKTCTEL